MESVTNSVNQYNGHYEISLLLRGKDLKMPNNKRVVEQQTLQLKKRLQRQLSFDADCTAFMDDIIVKGFALRCLKRNHNVVMGGCGISHMMESITP